MIIYQNMISLICLALICLRYKKFNGRKFLIQCQARCLVRELTIRILFSSCTPTFLLETNVDNKSQSQALIFLAKSIRVYKLAQVGQKASRGVMPMLPTVDSLLLMEWPPLLVTVTSLMLGQEYWLFHSEVSPFISFLKWIHKVPFSLRGLPMLCAIPMQTGRLLWLHCDQKWRV